MEKKMSPFVKFFVGIGNYFKAIVSNLKLKHFVLYLLMLAVMIVCIILGSLGIATRSTRMLFENIGYTIIAVVSLSLVVGFLGELSLGHAAFMSIGAIFATFFQNIVYPSFTASNPLLALLVSILIGAVIAGLFGFLVGLPALKLKGDYLAIVTLAFGEIVKTVFTEIDAFGGALGLENKFRYNDMTLYIIIFVIAFIVVILCKNLIRSKHGRAITAIRDNEIAAKASGINSNFYKIFVFVFAAFLAGIAGGLFGASKSIVQASTFSYSYSINNILVVVILGGMGSINGSVIAAILVTFIDVKLQTILTGDLAAINNIIYALLLIVVILYRNVPSLANFRNKYNFKNLFFVIKKWFYKTILKKNIKNDPSIEKSYPADWSKVPTKIDMDARLGADIKKYKETEEEIKESVDGK